MYKNTPLKTIYLHEINMCNSRLVLLKILYIIESLINLLN